jgi:hypothetical protein
MAKAMKGNRAAKINNPTIEIITSMARLRRGKRLPVEA